MDRAGEVTAAAWRDAWVRRVLAQTLKPPKPLGHARSSPQLPVPRRGSSRAANIIRCRKENLDDGEDYDHAQCDVKTWIDLNSP